MAAPFQDSTRLSKTGVQEMRRLLESNGGLVRHNLGLSLGE